LRYAELERGIPQKIEAARSEWELIMKSQLEVGIRAKIEEFERRNIVLEHSLSEKTREVEIWARRLEEQEREYQHHSEETKKRFAVELKLALEGEERRISAEWELRLKEREATIRKELEGKIYLLIKENEELVATIELRKHEFGEIKIHVEREISIAKVPNPHSLFD
jgi:hypothetical protein